MQEEFQTSSEHVLKSWNLLKLRCFSTAAIFWFEPKPPPQVLPAGYTNWLKILPFLGDLWGVLGMIVLQNTKQPVPTGALPTSWMPQVQEFGELLIHQCPSTSINHDASPGFSQTPMKNWFNSRREYLQTDHWRINVCTCYTNSGHMSVIASRDMYINKKNK